MEEVVNNFWQKSKLLIKGLMIGVLVLLLLIPAHFVQELVKEREQRQKEAVLEVSSKWAGSQTIVGPLIVVPYWSQPIDTVKRTIPEKRFAYFLPDKLDIQSEIRPQEKHRGIYKVMLYQSTTKLDATFNSIDPSLLKIPQENILWNEAFAELHIADSKGLNEELKMQWNNKTLSFSPSPHRTGRNALTSPLNISSGAELSNARFTGNIFLNGSEQLLFTPLGKSTSVQLSSSWKHPSFTGNILPQSSEINDTGFTAKWNSLSHTRNFPQQWLEGAYSIGDFSGMHDPSVDGDVNSSSFGMELFVPVNGYQKTMRSVKYAILCILLTFTAFFLIETTNKKSVHPVQYALIGFALILFYTLLLSFSEYIGFNQAYTIAAIATIGLITWFVKGLLGSMKLSMLLSFILILMYSYVFTILQLQDYALLLGSIGLFLTLAVVMFFSRKIQW